MHMPHRQLSQFAPPVSAFGLGCMAMSDIYGPSDRTESLRTLHAALEAGINLIDTGDFYGMGHNEMLIREALEGVPRERYVLSVKFGALRGPKNEFSGIDNRPVALRNFLTYSLKRLGVDYIDIYRPARLDPNVPIEETVGAIADLIKEGYVRQVGLSEVGADTLRRASRVHPIVDLQIEYSLASRSLEREILPTCRELGIGITAYGVLSRGLISGHWRKERAAAAGDFRAASPRFQGANLDANLKLVDNLKAVAASLDASVAQVAIAWVAAQDPSIVPLIGARTRDRLSEALGALRLSLDADALKALARAMPPEAVAGTRYAAAQMAHLDSEKGSAHA